MDPRDDSIVGSIVGELPLILLILYSAADDRSAVVGTMIYIPLVSFLMGLEENFQVGGHFPF